MRSFALFFLGSLYFCCKIIGQTSNIGIPFIKNFPNSAYQAGTQNWNVEQHPAGFLFFANNSGLLQFDGSKWECFPLPNKTIVRSLHIDPSGKIYVGGQNEFGYFLADEFGQLRYHSLLDQFPSAHRNFEDVWEIISLADRILFFTSNKLFELENKKIRLLSEEPITFLGEVGGRAFIKSNTQGLLEFKNGRLETVKGGDKLTQSIVEGMVQIGNKILIATQKNGIFELTKEGIYPWQNDGAAFFQKNRIYTIALFKQDNITVGTATGGLILLNQQGEISYHLNTEDGLQNNSVLSILEDKETNLWLGLENGIDYIQINSPFSRIIPDGKLEGMAYAATVFNEQLYLGTSNGLFTKKWNAHYNPLQNNLYTLIPGTVGQVWGLSAIGADLFLGHHEGAFQISNKGILPALSRTGSWIFQDLHQREGYLIAGTYTGISLFKKEHTTWQFVKTFPELTESCRILEQDNVGNIWIAHPYRGIYKANISPDLSKMEMRLYGAKDGLPSNNLNHVFKINKELVFTGETGIFKYDVQTDSFLHYTELEALLGTSSSILRLFEDSKKNIWYVQPEETGLLKIIDRGISRSFTKIPYPELSEELVRGFEFIYPYDESNVFIGAEIGFIHFNPLKNNYPKLKPQVSINGVYLITEKDSLLFANQYDTTNNHLDRYFSAAQNAFRFSYTAFPYASSKQLTFQSQLEGFDNTWSEKSGQRERTYTNLSPGTYTFWVKAIGFNGKESIPASYSFEILPPWYASRKACLLYIALFLAFLSSIVVIPRKYYKKQTAFLKSEQERKEKEYQKIVAQAEKEMILLKNKTLESEISFKNKELATTTMYLEQRNSLIHKLQKQLAKIAKETNQNKTKKDIQQLIMMLGNEEQLSDDWEQFALHFDRVHINFLQRLRQQYPQLTPSDEKLCAFLRMNLSSKEIAPLMHISIRGVEIGRHRLRKKLNLESDVNLNRFMQAI